MSKVIVTLTTVPTRLLDPSETCGTRPGLRTILEQSDVEYEVHFNIPEVHRNTIIRLPDWLSEWQEKYPHLKVFRCPDYGPITKIYPTIQRVTDPETILITVDDDLFYNDGFIKGHLEARTRYPEYAIGYAGMSSLDETLPPDERGIHPAGKYYFVTSVPEDVRVKMLEGYKTVSYKRHFFQDDFKKFIFAHWNDDVVISAYMGYRNIKKIVLKCENCNGDFSARVESFPVISHTVISGQIHGCNAYRRNPEVLEQAEVVSNNWYRLGYLER